MGREHRNRRRSKIKINQKRHSKLNHLRAKYQNTTSADVKDKIWEKVFKMAPQLTRAQFETSIKDSLAFLKKIQLK